jgi:hypothetical protein
MGGRMDDLSFAAKIAEVLGSFIWPLVIGAIVIVFRPELGRLIDRIKRIKTGWFDAEMDEVSEAGRAAAKEEPALAEAAPKLEDASEIAESKPPVRVVIDSYTELQKYVSSLDRLVPPEVQKAKIRDLGIVRWLAEEKLIKPSTLQLYSALRAARKACERDDPESISDVEADLYRQNCLLVRAAIDRARAKLQIERGG